MTTPSASPEPSVAVAFIQNARELIGEEYLPKVERCVEKLTDEQVWWRPHEDSNSVGNLLLHISGNARQWIICGLGGAIDQRQRQSEFDERRILPREELLTLFRATLTEVDGVLACFDVPRLLETFPIQGTEVTALEAIFHVTEHISMHTGQIILLTKMLTGSDLVFYDFSTGKPVHTWHDKQHQ